MKIYKPTQAAHENMIVSELNAAVLTNTFSRKNCVQKADLYYNVKGCGKLVGSGTCPPVNCVFMGTVEILF